jgi:hypothetical protein
MPVSARLVIKKMEECQVGELIRYGYGDKHSLAIVSQAYGDEVGQLRCIVLKSSGRTDDLGLAIDSFGADDFPGCASFGTNWVIELLDSDDTFPGNPAGADTKGVVRVFGTGQAMIVGYADGRHASSLGLFDLSTFQAQKKLERHNGAPVARWRLWTSDEHRTTLGAEPLFEFSADFGLK